MLYKLRRGVWVVVALGEASFFKLVVWCVPQPLRGSNHNCKYRMALVSSGIYVPRYDNEAAKGDPKRSGAHEVSYQFVDLATLQADFWHDVEHWRHKP